MKPLVAVGQYSVRSLNACVRSTVRCPCSGIPPAAWAHEERTKQGMSRAACRIVASRAGA